MGTEVNLNRRDVLKGVAAATCTRVAAPMLNLRRFPLFARSETQYSTRAIDLVTESLIIDMLSPLSINGETIQRWGPDLQGFSEADRQEFELSAIDVFHVAFGIGGATYHEVYDNTLSFVAAHNAAIAGRPDALIRIDSSEDFERARVSNKIGVLIGVQSSSHFRTPDDVNAFHGLGQRVSQLTYNSRNLIGNGSTERIDGGVSDFGVSIIERMNEIGMAIDVSHCGDRTTLDAFELSSRPVLITHSNVRALCPGHPRCKADDAIRAVGGAGGVMGITGVRMFVTIDEPTTIEDFLNHIDYVRDLIGIEHVGIGSDTDLHGYDDLPASQLEAMKSGYKDSYAFREKLDIEGIDHPQRMFDIAEGLLRRGYTDEHVRLVLGENFRRVLTQIWTTEPPPEDEPAEA